MLWGEWTSGRPPPGSPARARGAIGLARPVGARPEAPQRRATQVKAVLSHNGDLSTIVQEPIVEQDSLHARQGCLIAQWGLVISLSFWTAPWGGRGGRGGMRGPRVSRGEAGRGRLGPCLTTEGHEQRQRSRVACSGLQPLAWPPVGAAAWWTHAAGRDAAGLVPEETARLFRYKVKGRAREAEGGGAWKQGGSSFSGFQPGAAPSGLAWGAPLTARLPRGARRKASAPLDMACGKMVLCSG